MFSVCNPTEDVARGPTGYSLFTFSTTRKQAIESVTAGDINSSSPENKTTIPGSTAYTRYSFAYFTVIVVRFTRLEAESSVTSTIC
jgi:hypothetical protein